ncbi:hypothetical protein [Pseudoxanthomonas sacheonensis]|uniref:hypothetical protein n=1 Tax=Pseudoxanthomonas sacheonensis TaxID=443615 RepID=UPI0013D1C5C9|nr:hypothetical protein [Pseudoxanthomonas sacheonensis]
MARNSSGKKDSYGAWLLTKVFDELTGNYFGNATTDNQMKPLISERPRISDGGIHCAEEFDGSSGAGFD